jgi:predicted 2-oxoglutarate/Fe(II)-dependent dioxygenase YbiX
MPSGFAEQHIRHFRDAASPELCRSIIKLYEQDSQLEREGTCPNKTIMPEGDPYTKQLRDLAWQNTKQYFDAYLFEEFEGCYVLDHMVYSCYEVGSFYKTHTDSNFEDGKVRTISCILYLNDNFEGGELIFPREALAIKPVTGTMSIFPTGFLLPHAVRMATDRRHTVAFFFYKTVDHNEIHFNKELELNGLDFKANRSM